MSKIFNKKIQPAQLFRYFVLISWLHITANALFRSSEVMSKVVPSDTHRYKNSGATPTKDGRAYHKICVKERVPKIFEKQIDAIFPPLLLIGWLRIGTNALFKSSEVIPGR